MLSVTWFVPGNTEKHGTTGYGRALFCAFFHEIRATAISNLDALIPYYMKN